ncbi:serine protease [Actinomadura graeca]|uniref:Serine protease n=1 Tax=Actinomadura graeca TaxID=2750812 RepID=A0ABX8QMV3_9ACTN|nr:serine protease [Actinomadura graeca]QXJ19921.1 serine protease [Actinomadura graeca]
MRKLRLTLAASAAALPCLGLAAPTALAASAEPGPPGPDAPASTMIIGGEDATEPYPFMVSFQNDVEGHFCGGSLLTGEWVVTALHCVDGDVTPESLRIRVGSVRKSEGGSLRGARQIVLHPEGREDHFDVALVRLDRPVTEAPITLDTRQPVGTPTRLLGWGCTVTKPVFECGDDDKPEVLKQLDSAIREPGTCVSETAPIEADSEVCTGNPETKTGACFGDSGGPLLRKTAGGWRLIGAFSRTEVLPKDPDAPGPQFPDCRRGPSIYTDVTVHREWINSVISAAA